MTQRTRRTRRPTPRTMLAAVAALGVGAAVLAPPVTTSDAAWIDPVHATSSLQALTLAQPQPVAVSTCNFVPLNTSTPQFAVQWRWPAGTSMPTTSATAVWTIDGVTATQTTTGPVNGVFTTTFNASQLRDIEAPIAGATYDARASTRLAAPGTTPWTTQARLMATMNIDFWLIESCSLAT